MCTFVVCYGCADLVHERVVLCVPVCCATQNVSYYVYQYTVLPIALYLGFAGVCATYFEAPALCVRQPSATAVLPLCMNVSYYVYQYTVLPVA